MRKLKLQHKQMQIHIFLMIAAFVITFGFSIVESKQVCEADFCLINWNMDTIVLPSSVVSVKSSFRHCSPTYVIEGGARQGDTISIFFVIDQSGSMATMDSINARYRIALELIDSLYAHSPASEVGVAVFSNQLLYNYQNDPFFVQLFPQNGWPDSYAPLTRLDAQVNGMRGIDKIKQVLQLSSTPNDTDFAGNRKLVKGYYGPTGRHDGHPGLENLNIGYNGTTDISLAFDAARKAFTSARYPKNRQYMIFLSDGEPQFVDLERKANFDDYLRPAGLPATFTAYFINASTAIPRQMLIMNDSIRNNGYSSSNPSSAIWKSSGASGELFSRLIRSTKVFGPFADVPSDPVSMKINNIAATSFNETHAIFPTSFPLTSSLTKFVVDFTYRYRWPLDSIASQQFIVHVATKENIPLENGVTLSCRDQGTLRFFHNGQEIPEGQAILDAQKTLEIRYYPPDGVAINNAEVKLTNIDGTDTLTLSLALKTGYFSSSFQRDFGTSRIDNILQHGTSDSVIAIYRNPSLPLDVVRTSRTVTPARGLAPVTAYYLDQNADGYPDIIRIIQASDKLTSDELALIRSAITIPTQRNTTIQSLQLSTQGFDILLAAPSNGKVFTGLYTDEKIIFGRVGGLTGGAEFPQTTIALIDSMAPVILSANYYDLPPSTNDTLDVVFSENVRSIGNARPFNLSRGSAIQKYQIQLSLVNVRSDSATFFVVPAAGQEQPQDGDKIWIDETAGVADYTIGIVQKNPGNVRRTLGYYSLIQITAARYVDTDGNGTIDKITVTTDQPIDQPILDSLKKKILLPAYREFTIGSLAFTTEGFEIAVTQPSGKAPITGVNSSDILQIRGFETSSRRAIRENQIPITDGLAPVISSAQLKPGAPKSDGSFEIDTLVITMSEVIMAPTSKTPFVVLDTIGTPHLVTVESLVSNTGVIYTFTYSKIDGYTAPPSEGTLIRLNYQAEISDQAGNKQTIEKNRAVPLKLGEFKMSYQVKIGPNPFNPLNAPIPGNNAYGVIEKNGTIVLVKPIGRLVSSTNLRATLSLYDELGNVVVRDAKGTLAPKNQMAFVWDGTNTNGRYVGSGIYTAIITMIDNNSKTVLKPVKIGVRR